MTRSRTRHGPAVTLRLGAKPEAVTAARHAVAATFGSVVSASVLQDLELCVTELVSNAVRHSGMAPDEVFELSVTISDGHVEGTITDSGRGFVPTHSRAEPTATSGWGLYLLDAIASRWGVEKDDGAQVWFELER